MTENEHIYNHPTYIWQCTLLAVEHSHPTSHHSQIPTCLFVLLKSALFSWFSAPPLHPRPRANGMQAANYGIGMSGRERSLAGSLSDMSNLVD